MTFTKHLIVFFLLNLYQSGVLGRVLDKREIDYNTKNVTIYNFSPYEKSVFPNFEEKNLEQEILQELNHLGFRKQREIFDDLEKQHEKFNTSQKTLALSESEVLSPLNVEELKNIRKTIKATNSSLPAIRNKRTLNFLLNLVARAMGYTLTPSNPDAEWIPRQQPQPSPQPCATPPPPCRPMPPSTTPPPCAPPPTTPPCPGSGALMQPATIPPNQINPNTISYPFRPARTIPLFNFAPLPAGIRVPYPPLLQPPAQQMSPCTPQQPSPPPCGTPAPPAPPCGTTPAPPMPQPCKPNPPPRAPPCGTTPPPPPPPPCGTTPAPSPPPCMTPAPPRAPPCGSTPAPKPQPCNTTPAPPPPCGTPPPPPPPPPPCATPRPSPPPCAPPASPPPCGSPPAAPPPPPPPPPPAPKTPKKDSLILEYDNPVRIEIFSNDKKYLPVSGRVYSGDYDDQQQDWHSHFFPSHEKSKHKDNDYEEEEMEEEHLEEEEEDESPSQLQRYEDEDEQVLANAENGEDESETNLSVVRKPIDQDIKKTQRRKAVSSKSKSVSADGGKKKEKEGNITQYENNEKTQKMKKPKRKKWVRIVKKQRRKTKSDSSPHENVQVYTSDSSPESSRMFPNIYGGVAKRAYDSYDVSDFSNDSGSQSSEDVENFKKVTINKKQIHSPELEKAYEFNINPYVHALEPEEARRAKLEKAVEKYVEDYVEKQLGQELIKNTGIPKTTVFEFAPKNGPKIQTITTTVAKSSHSGAGSAKTGNQRSTTVRPAYHPNGNTHVVRQSNYEQTLKKRGNNYEAFTRRF